MLCGFDERGIQVPSDEYLQGAKRFVLEHMNPSEPYFQYQQDRANQMFDLSDHLPILIWNESLRQQLTQGVGLLCPFWDGRICCGLRGHMERLARDVIVRPGSNATWKPTGCLS